jgi:hypothetical protein
VGSKAFGGLNRRLKEKTAESRWFETTGQAPFGRAKAAYWKINVELPPDVAGYSTRIPVGSHAGTPSCPRSAKRWEVTGHRRRENPVNIPALNDISLRVI